MEWLAYISLGRGRSSGEVMSHVYIRVKSSGFGAARGQNKTSPREHESTAARSRQIEMPRPRSRPELKAVIVRENFH